MGYSSFEAKSAEAKEISGIGIQRYVLNLNRFYCANVRPKQIAAHTLIIYFRGINFQNNHLGLKPKGIPCLSSARLI